jgi:hypothetical protein
MFVFIFLAIDHLFCSVHRRRSVDTVIIGVRVRATLRLEVYRQSDRLGSKPWDPQVFLLTEHLRLQSLYNILSEEMGLSFTISAGPRQHSHS